jgi:hypothetical protein
LWWNDQEWIKLAPTDWPGIDFNPPTDNLEIKKVLVTLNVKNDFIQRFSRLNRLLSHSILQEVSLQLSAASSQQDNHIIDTTRF